MVHWTNTTENVNFIFSRSYFWNCRDQSRIQHWIKGPHKLLKCCIKVSFSCISNIIKQSHFPNFTFFRIFYKDCKVLLFQKFWQSKNNKGLSLHPLVNMNLSPIAVLESKEITLQASKDEGVKKWIGQLYN